MNGVSAGLKRTSAFWFGQDVTEKKKNEAVATLSRYSAISMVATAFTCF